MQLSIPVPVADVLVEDIAVLPNEKIMLAGWFQKYNNQDYPRIVRC